MHATRPLAAGSVLGVYRSMTMLPSEELHFRHNPPESYPKSTAHWRQAVDAYAAELGPPPQRTWGKKLLQEVFDKTLQVYPNFAISLLQRMTSGALLFTHRMLPSGCAVTSV